MQLLDFSVPLATGSEYKAPVVSEADQLTEPLSVLEELLAALEAPATRIDACKRLHELATSLSGKEFGGSGLSLKLVQTPKGGTLKLILHPAVFPPEQWSRTFAEGLLKNPLLYAGKKMVEIGVGCGWISLLMLEDTAVLDVLGLDINPVAVLVSKINAWLNGTNADGSYRYTRAGKPMPEAFRAEVSDLLQEPLSRDERFDHVIGCIPQVLHPDPEAMGRLEDTPTQKDLYDLSNYCFEQGIIEDRYGLPLVARALAQSHLCLKPQGMVTFMMGGRPGCGPIEEMFRRRGFTPQLLWSRRVSQACDTDIASLAALEKHYGLNFHFYVSATSNQSIPATTVVQLLSSGRPVFHDVFVYQAAPRLESASIVLKNLNRLGLAGAWPDLDLSAVDERQARFLEYLTGSLVRQRLLPPAQPRLTQTRLVRLAQLAARFLRAYCQYSVEPGELVIGLRSRLIPSLLKAVGGQDQNVIVTDCLESAYRPLLAEVDLKTTVGNTDLSDLLELDEALSPRACIIAPWQLRDSSAPLVVRLLAQHADRHRDRLYIVDDSQHFEAGCERSGNFMLKLLGGKALAPNVVLLYTHTSQAFEMTGLLNVPQQIRAKIDCAAPDAGSQVFYEWLFSDLLRFTLETDYFDNNFSEPSGVPEELAKQILRGIVAQAQA